MATDYLVTNTELEDIADAIRAKGGTASLLTFPNGFTTAIAAIPTGITPTGTKQISISQNGTTTEDVTNYANAEISVAVPSATLTTKSITANGTYNASSDSADGYSSVTVNVSGGGSSNYVTGTVTLSADVVAESGATKLFPNLQMPFKPDVFLLSVSHSLFGENITKFRGAARIKSVLAIKKDLCPPFQVDSSSSSSTDGTTNDYVWFAVTTVGANSGATCGYACTGGFPPISSATSPYWSLNNDGTFSFGRIASTSTANFYATTYRYFGMKVS